MNQNLLSNSPEYFNDSFENAQKSTDITENRSPKRHLLFSETTTVSPSHPELISVPNLQAKANKPILKTSTNVMNNRGSLQRKRQVKEKK